MLLKSTDSAILVFSLKADTHDRRSDALSEEFPGTFKTYNADNPNILLYRQHVSLHHDRQKVSSAEEPRPGTNDNKRMLHLVSRHVGASLMCLALKAYQTA